MPITALYAALLAPVLIALSVRTIAWRRSARIAFGHGEDGELLRRTRAHANFAEYVPYALILIGLAESLAAPSLLLHALGAGLVAGRCVHAYALSRNPHSIPLRVLGMSATFAVIIVAALCTLVLAVVRLI